jgi:hypothetical protein
MSELLDNEFYDYLLEVEQETIPVNADNVSFNYLHVDQPSTSNYVPVTDVALLELVQGTIPLNTKRKQDWAVGLFNKWLAYWRVDTYTDTLKVLKPLKDMTVSDINHCLKYWIPSLRKEDGSKYPPRTMKEIIALFQHYLNKVMKMGVSIFTDPGFEESRQILDAAMKKSAREGNVKCVKRAQVISKEQELQLWHENILGDRDPVQLINTLLFYLGMHLCLRAAQEHRDLEYGDKSQLTLHVNGGKVYLEYIEITSKNRSFGLKQSRLEPKSVRICESQLENDPRCVIRLYKEYISHR